MKILINLKPEDVALVRNLANNAFRSSRAKKQGNFTKALEHIIQKFREIEPKWS